MSAIDCTEFEQQLDDWLDGHVEPAAARSRLQAHAADCASCGASLAAMRQLRGRLRDLTVPTLRPGYFREAYRKARQVNGDGPMADPRRDLLFAGGGAAVAAVCMAAVLIALRPFGSPAVASADASTVALPFQTVSLTVGHVESVRLRIDAPRDFENVRFAVELPDRVWLADQPGIRALAWDGALRKGENVLEIPVVAQDGAQGFMTTRVSWGTFQQRLQANLIGVPAPAAGTTSAGSRGGA